jgi:hypothetical protein
VGDCIVEFTYELCLTSEKDATELLSAEKQELERVVANPQKWPATGGVWPHVGYEPPIDEDVLGAWEGHSESANPNVWPAAIVFASVKAQVNNPEDREKPEKQNKLWEDVPAFPVYFLAIKNEDISTPVEINTRYSQVAWPENDHETSRFSFPVSAPVYDLFKRHESQIVQQVTCALGERVAFLRNIAAQRERCSGMTKAAKSARYAREK